MLQNLQSQVEQVPHLAHMTRELLERMAQPHLHNPPLNQQTDRDHWALRLVGTALLGGGITLVLAAASVTIAALWPAGLMSASGLYLILRR